MPYFTFGANGVQGTPVSFSLFGGNAVTLSGANSNGQPTNSGQFNFLAPGFYPTNVGNTFSPGGGINGSIGGLDIVNQVYTSFNPQALEVAISNGYSGDINIDAGTWVNNIGGNVRLISGGGSNLSFTDANAQVHFFCGSTTNDWVGVQAPGSTPQIQQQTQGCNPYDIFDVSNRETFGDGYMHWYANSAATTPPGWNGTQVVPTGGWNTGISNPSTGVLSFDSTTDGDASGKVKMGTLVLTSSQGGAISFQDGTTQSSAWNGTTLGGDYAESIDVLGDRATYGPGDIIIMNASAPGKFTKSQTPYSKLVSGVFSTKPGLTGRRVNYERPDKAAEVPMAMMGIVPTKVSTENGPIAVGDLLVSASLPGYAMKGTDREQMMGAVIGKALAPISFGSGIIEVLVSLQ